MKKLFILSLILVVLTACGRQGKTINQKQNHQNRKSHETAVFITDGIPQKVIIKGSEACTRLQNTLKTQLIAAMQEQGLKGAVDFCSSEALKLTEDVNLYYQGILNIKRTSLKFRNPANKPDKFEKQALLLLRKNMAASGTPPDHLVQKISGNGQIKYRYYKPLLIRSTCLGCHGNEKKIKPEILKMIKEKYPEGTATGYVKGQLRGVIRVEMNASALTSNP
ncbi:MAG: DUF3365 domain-containing protein [Acidobacteria bacterium]|nr:DUF3365 domain-containing protein [Acidobacteriota bacterium]